MNCSTRFDAQEADKMAVAASVIKKVKATTDSLQRASRSHGEGTKRKVYSHLEHWPLHQSGGLCKGWPRYYQQLC